MPEISVLLASYNGARYIREQLDSILSQTVQDFELIVCDDCSKDDTVRIVEEYAAKDSRVMLFKNEHNLGFKKNFERLLGLASGEYLALCDQDDIWFPNHLEILLNCIGDGDIATGNAMLVDGDGNDLHCTNRDCDKIERVPYVASDEFFTMLYRCYVYGSATIIRKSFVPYILPIPEDMHYHDQWIGIVATLHNGISYTNECVLKYRQHGGNCTTDHVKWYSLAKIKQFIFSDGNRHIYSEQLEFLEALSKTGLNFSEAQRKEIQDAKKFHENLLARRPWKSFVHFVKNYRKIYCSENPVFFCIRLILIFVLGK